MPESDSRIAAPHARDRRHSAASCAAAQAHDSIKYRHASHHE
jgi:hypothetical protein